MATSVTACFARVAKTLSPEDREQVLAPLRRDILAQLDAQRSGGADARALAVQIIDRMLADTGEAPAPTPAATSAPAAGPRPAPAPAPAPRPSAKPDAGFSNGQKLAQAMKAQRDAEAAPAPAPAADLPTDADLAADQELQDALSKLGDVLGDVFGAKKNITGPQYSAADLLPTLSKVVELLVRKGFRSFKVATARAAQLMRGNPATASHVDAISPRQWKAAYNAIAEGHDGTDSEDAVAAMTADEVRGLVAAPEQAQNAAGNATRPLDRPGPSALEGAPSGDVRAPGEGGNAGSDAAGSRGRDGTRDANAGGAGRDADGGVGDGPAEPPAAGPGAGRTGRTAGGRRGVRNGGSGQSGAEQPADAGRAGDLNPAPNAAPIQPPAFKAQDFTITDELALGEGGQKTKFRANVDAIRLLKDLDATGRAATVDEQKVLARYVGWGGLSQAFDGDNDSWSREYAELKDLLTPDEYADARQSTRYAHYTSREIIGGMYSALRRLGFTGGRMLEPGGGVGNFLGLMPTDLRTASRATLVEREPIAAGIARHLYPQQNIQRADFADFIGTDDYFDAAIGNPPFADTPLTDGSGRKHLSGLSVHNYFFAKSVDHLREGGVLAMVVTSSFLDARGDRARRYIAERTRFLGAIRLPNNAFSKNANTEVTTDIIFLQKRPEAEWGGKAAMQEAQAWLKTAAIADPRGGAELEINQYFADRPEMMLGTYGRYGTMYGPDQPALVAKPEQDTAALLQAAIANLPADVYVPPAVAGTDRLVDQTVVALKDPQVQEGGYYVEGDKLFQRLPDVAGEARAREITPSTQWTEKTTLGDSGYAKLVSLSQMRGTLRALLAAELSGAKTMEPLRGKLNREYDAYVKEHGLLNDQGTTRVFDDDPDFPLLASLEHEYTPGMGIAAAKRQGIKPYRSTAKKAPIFTQRVVQAREQVRRVETPADALAVSIAERGRIDSAYIGELLGRDSQQVLEELSSGSKPLLFRDPATDEYVLRDAYLSGNVRTKLVQARQAGLFTNAQELEKVQPEDVGAANIYARIGSPWVPEDVYRDFALELFGEGTKAAVVYVPLNSSFAVGVKPGSGVASSNTWGTPEYPGEDLLSSLMNNREIKVTYRDQDGKTHVDQDATERANVKAQDIRNRFQDWLFADPDRSEVLVRAYNDTNNNYVTRNYDGSWMTFPGKVPDSIIKFRRHQRNAIARIVQDRTALLDHVVGAGKTFTIVSAAMELKRTGLAKKPLIVVPNHLVKQWASDFYRLYPGAKILTATKKDFAKANRRKFLAKIATGDWDAVVMAHSSFGFLRPAPDFEAQFNQGQVKRIVDTIKAVEDQDGDERAKKRTVKQLEALKERLENRIKSLRQKPIDNLLDYDQIGVDQLFVDEAHLFKNLMFTTKMQNIRGLGDSKGSQRAYDMYVKVAETYAKNGRGQGVVFATGTPVSNTLAEMYHMMRYLMPQAMEDLGFQSFDAWANTFASVNQEWDQKSSGDGFKAINTMSSFVNTHELLRIFDQVADTVTMDDIKAAFREENDGKEFPLPKLKTGRRQPVSLVKSTAQTKYMETIAARAAALERRKGPPQKGEDNALVIMTDARKAAMDVRLVDPAIIEREKGGRIDRAANEVLARWNQYADVKGTQLVFSDLGTPIKTVKAELREYQELQARMAPLADEDLVASAQLGDETAIGKLEDAEAARDELDKKGADWLTAIQAALRGFSVYDDLRAALVERGIPENQIAFIHDYNTDEQKAALFRKVNAGEIRVLMGSTAKLGAGTNVQERLVALHHLDVPWKPSDIEQREGRILRQGNRLEREVPAFEVEILAYVTQDTLDMKMWMIQERKLKMINQLRTRKIDREIENSFEDMEMSAGEMQAAATGNMDMLREIQLRTEVKKLEQRKRAFEAQRNDLESRRRRAEKEIAELPSMIERFDMAASAAEQYNKALRTREVPRSTINGETFTDRDAALKKLRELSDAHERALEQRRQALAETYETAARESRESGMAEGAAINAAEAARDAKDKELPKPKMAVEFNGKTYGSKPALAQAAAEFYGDAHAIEWTLPDGKVLNRRELITKALSQPVAESVSEEAVTEVGSVGPFSVSIEGQRDRRGDKKMLEVLITPEGGEPESEVVYLRGDEDNAAARAAAEVVGAVEMLIFRAGGQADYARSRLESAKRTLAELKKTIVASEWPEADKLAKARAAHRQVLDRLAGKRDVSTNLKQTGRPEANETDVVFRIDAADLPADTATAYAAPTEADQRAVKRLQLRMARYIPGVRLDAVAAAGGRAAGQPLQGADRARVAAAELLRALTGRRAVFFKADRAKFVNGVHSSAEPDVLFLRADSSRPHMAVLGHEFLHGLRADRPDLYEALRDRIRLVAPGRAAHGADLQAKRTSVAQPLLDADKLEEEFLADVMGDSWMDAGFWRDLAGKEPAGPLRKAFRAAFRFISDVLGKLADMNPFGSDVYLSDVRAARKAMAQALREYVQVESVGAPEIDADSFSTDERAPWYSALERAIAAQPMRGGGASAWENAVKGLIASGKVKADEVEWSGLREWLAMQPGLITKASVQQYLKANGVQVQETVLAEQRKWGLRDAGSGLYPDRFDSEKEAQEAAEDFAREFASEEVTMYRYDDRWYVGLSEADEATAFDTKEEANREYDRLVERAAAAWDIETVPPEKMPEHGTSSRYAQYTLPGGTNYREVLLTLPPAERKPRFDVVSRKDRSIIHKAESREAAQAWIDGHQGVPAARGAEVVERSAGQAAAPEYKSGHWDQPNVLAHIRLNDRTDADGKRVLFVEEIQSDWAQEGKKKGWFDPKVQQSAAMVREGIARGERPTAEQQPVIDGLLAVRNAPFVDKTDKWVALALKRIVKMAVDEGYERIAFVTGEQSAERYDLSKQVRSIAWTGRGNDTEKRVTITPNSGNDIEFMVQPDGAVGSMSGRSIGNEFDGKRLDDIVGKDVAERIMSAPYGDMRGNGLKVGGEGMKAFYDRIVPAALKDLLRKVGGGALRSVAIEDRSGEPDSVNTRTFEETWPKLQQPGFDITPEMREAAAGGMPMFSMAPPTESDAFKRWFGDSKVVDAQGKPLVVYHGTPDGEVQFQQRDRGAYFTSSPHLASDYTRQRGAWMSPGKAPAVHPVYLSMQNPLVIDALGKRNDNIPVPWQPWKPKVFGNLPANAVSVEKALAYARERGHDGLIVRNVNDAASARETSVGDVYAVLRPEQIKSATGNRGTFDPNEADINFSIAVDTLQSNETARRLSERAMDVIRSDSTIGVLGRTVGTPYHLAHAKRADGSLRNPDLRRVYDEAQDYLNDINTFANDPAELAPGVVPMLNKWSDVARPLRLAGEQRAKLARALFEGTLGWTRDDQGNPVQTEDTHQGIEWTATELKQRFGFDDADVGRYQQTRAAIGRSLDYMAAAEVARQMGGRDLPEGLRAMVSRGDTGRFRGLVTNFLTQQVDGAKFALSMLKTEHRQQLASITGPDADAKRVALKAKQAIALEVAQERLDKWQGLQRGVQKVYDRVTDLKDRGYMPLMRFGPHTVTVRDIDTKEVVFFGMYETQAEANVEARRLRESATPNEAVSRGEMSQEQWRLFKGMSPETIELFGQVAGVERTPVFEEYIRRTKANHSALKRLIQRKGTPGFSEDVQRVLAAFLTSNARAAAANLHAGAMEEATQDIDQERGLVKDYATKLTQYVQNPSDEAQAIRGLMFVQYIGGSVASAMVNMTQPFTMTLPYLSQYGGPAAAARLLTAGMRSALSRIDPKSDLGKAMARAEKDGIVSPQALHELQGQAVNRFGRTESFLRSLGVSTKAAEAIDASLRRVLFAWGGFFSLAEQFNRRATFIAAYQLAQEKGMADAFAFAEEAVTETQGQYSRANRPQWARGPVMSTVFTFKQFSIAYIEFLARLPRREKAIAMAVLLVAAGLEGLPFADDLDDLIDTIAQRIFGKAFSAKRAKVELLSEVLGRDGAEWVLRGASALPGFPVDLAGRMSLGNMIPGTGVLRTDGAKDKSGEVLEALGPAGGVVRDALRGEFLPVAMRNAAKAAEMGRTGQYRDELGRKVADVDGVDTAFKAVGFQPRQIARESRDSRMAQSVVSQTRAAESEIVRLWAQGIVDNEPDKVAEARARLDAWNERNPTARIAINRMQIARQVRDMRATREERLIRATPKELRGRVAQELQQ